MRKMIFQCQYGSHLFGTSTPESDRDFKGVYLPDAREILLSRGFKTSRDGTTKDPHDRSKNTSEDVDSDSYTLHRFLDLCMEGQTVAVEMLFCPRAMTTVREPEWDRYVLANRSRLIHRGSSAFFGYAQKQAAKYGIKGSRIEAVQRTLSLLCQLEPHAKLLEHACEADQRILELADTCDLRSSMGEAPLIQIVECRGPNGRAAPHLEVCGRKVPLTAEVKYAQEIFQKILDNYGERARLARENKNVDWKAMSHAVRVGDQAIELLTTGKLTFPRPNADFLTAIKRGKVEYDYVAALVEEKLATLVEVQKTSKLPDSVPQHVVEDITCEAYGDHLCNT